MHKKSMIMIAMVAVMLVSILPVFAAKPTSPAASNGLNKGKNDHLYLYEKDPDTWEIVEEDAAWAKMNINIKNNKFVCNAHGLNPDAEYLLICYNDPWPGTGSLILGSDIADEAGNVHIKGIIDYEDLPPEGGGGSKIWLVLALDFTPEESDSDTGEMTLWTPTEYLFEFDLINKQVATE